MNFYACSFRALVSIGLVFIGMFILVKSYKKSKRFDFAMTQQERSTRLRTLVRSWNVIVALWLIAGGSYGVVLSIPCLRM